MASQILSHIVHTGVGSRVCVERGDMLPHVRLTREPRRTEGAAVRPLPRVGPCVSGEVFPSDEPGRAHLAPVRLHTVVRLHVSGVMRHFIKRGPTLLTLAHLPGMDAAVSRQIADLCERLPADVTHVRPLAGMCPAVTGQITEQIKRPAALVTAVWPLSRVSEAMISKMADIVRRVLAPLTLVPTVPADVTVTHLDVLVQTTLSQTRVVAMDATQHGTTWQTESNAS